MDDFIAFFIAAMVVVFFGAASWMMIAVFG